MHYQVLPAAETKLVRCTKGAIYDVIIDMRPGSPTYMQHIGVELTADNRRALYVPELFAHGYQALTDDAEVVYQVGEFYTPDMSGEFVTMIQHSAFSADAGNCHFRKDAAWAPFAPVPV